MEKQNEKKKPERNEEKKETLEGLPMKDSPYLKPKDLEDYKRQGYGTEGHQEPKPGHGAAGSTDAPTLSGASLSSEREFSSTDAINRQGVP
ncbi:hypothetical protein SLE2022_363180 [Rubroshorea leprosula]